MKFSRAVLGILYTKYNGECFYCGAGVNPFDDWEPDHLTPRSQGGSDGIENLVLACRRCNRSKGGLNLEQYREAIRSRILKHIIAASRAADYIGHAGAGYVEYQLTTTLADAWKIANEARIVFYGEREKWLTEEEEKAADKALREIEENLAKPTLEEGEEIH